MVSGTGMKYLGILILIFVIMFVGVYFTAQMLKPGIKASNLKDMENVANKILEKAEEIHTLGYGSWSTLQVDLPNTISYAVIENNELVFVAYNDQRLVYFSDTPIKAGDDGLSLAALTPGDNKLIIKSTGDHVCIGIKDVSC